MICDIAKTVSYMFYRSFSGPFLITFYHNDETRNNFNLYKILKKYEKYFNDIPILRFDYDEFVSIYPNENVTSPNHFLIIEKNEKNIIYEFRDENLYLEILKSVRAKLL